MDSTVVVMVVGLSAFVSDAGDKAFYVMPFKDDAVESVMRVGSHTHSPQITYYEGSAFKTEPLDRDFEIWLAGRHKFEPVNALIVADSRRAGSDALRAECAPARARRDCKVDAGDGKWLNLVALVGTIHGGTGRMVPFDADPMMVANWRRTEKPTICTFVDYKSEEDITLVAPAAGPSIAGLGDIFVVESKPVGAPPKVRIGGSPLTLGLLQDCKLLLGKAGSCYPLVIANLSAAPKAEFPDLPLHTYLALADPSVKVAYDLLKPDRRVVRPVPIEVTTDGNGDSPYPCRPGAIVQ